MGDLEIWFLAVALAMDCFTVSIASGIILKKIEWKTIGLMSFCFGLFQTVMPVIGWLLTNRFRSLIENFDHWVAFGLLLFLGARMIWENIRENKEEAHFTPSSLKVILTLAVATSIDALAVGISFVCLGMDKFNLILYPISVIGLVSFLFTLVGSFIGIFIGRRFNWPVGMIGGLILIVIGFKILLEHLNII